MQLVKYAVKGFRSLVDVAEIPISEPTILAGPNDGGKTSALDALAFLLNKYDAVEDDLSSHMEDGARVAEMVEVVGEFETDPWEQETFGLEAAARIRRTAVRDDQEKGGWEQWTWVPEQEDLRDLTGNVNHLKSLVEKYGLHPEGGKNKPHLLAALRAHIASVSTARGWKRIEEKGFTDRLPQLIKFDGRALDPEAAVRAALEPAFKAYTSTEEFKGRLSGIEQESQEWAKTQVKTMEDHIVSRCPDIARVDVEPVVEVSAKLTKTKVRLHRSSGEAVRLDRSGLGSNRRIAIAAWEASKDVLLQQEATEAETPADGPEPVQTVVVYDEPDTHLDYRFQREVMRIIREQSALKRVRVVVATHAMNLIDGVDIRDVVLLRLNDARRTVVEQLGSNEHADFDAHLGMIASAVGVRNSVLLHERCFLAVEGETEQQVVPVLFRLATGMSLQAAGIALWGCGGNIGALKLAEYLFNHGRAVMLMIDSDSPEGQKVFRPKRLEEVFKGRQDEFVVLLGQHQGQRELEVLFDDEVWVRTANEAWPRSDGAAWTVEHFERKRSGKFSTDVLSMLGESSSDYPKKKSEMMMEIAIRLNGADDVPAQLRKTFKRLVEMAS